MSLKEEIQSFFLSLVAREGGGEEARLRIASLFSEVFSEEGGEEKLYSIDYKSMLRRAASLVEGGDLGSGDWLSLRGKPGWWLRVRPPVQDDGDLWPPQFDLGWKYPEGMEDPERGEVHFSPRTFEEIKSVCGLPPHAESRQAFLKRAHALIGRPYGQYLEEVPDEVLEVRGDLALVKKNGRTYLQNIANHPLPVQLMT